MILAQSLLRDILSGTIEKLRHFAAETPARTDNPLEDRDTAEIFFDWDLV